MNKNGTNPGMNVEDYEDMAVRKSNAAKRILLGGAAFVGGAGVAGGAAYAASQHPTEKPEDEALTSEDVMNGAEAGGEYKSAESETQESQATQETQTTSTHTTTEHVYVVETPAGDVRGGEAQPEEPTTVWEERTNYYADGEKLFTVERGRVNGYDFMTIDSDNDNVADFAAIDMNHDDHFEADEIVELSEEDNIRMGHQTATVTNEYFHSSEPVQYYDPTADGQNQLTQNTDPIYNNFEDEKMGDNYSGDFAENNPDYNPHGFSDSDGVKSAYLAENDSYTEDDTYSAGMADDHLDIAGADERYMADADNGDADDAYGTSDYALVQTDTDGDDDTEDTNRYMCVDEDDEYNHMSGDEMLLG